MADTMKKTGIAFLDYAAPVAKSAREYAEAHNGEWPTWEALEKQFPVPREARLLNRDGEPVTDGAGEPMNAVRAIFVKCANRYGAPKSKNARVKKSARPKLGEKFRAAVKGINAASGITQGRGSNDVDSETADELAELL